MPHIATLARRLRDWWTDNDLVQAMLHSLLIERKSYVSALASIHAEQVAARLREQDILNKLAQIIAATSYDSTPPRAMLHVLPSHGVTAEGPVKRPRVAKKNKA